MAQSPTGLNSLKSTPKAKQSSSSVFAARVKHAMVDDTTESEAFKAFGEWS